MAVAVNFEILIMNSKDYNFHAKETLGEYFMKDMHYTVLFTGCPIRFVDKFEFTVVDYSTNVENNANKNLKYLGKHIPLPENINTYAILRFEAQRVGIEKCYNYARRVVDRFPQYKAFIFYQYEDTGEWWIDRYMDGHLKQLKSHTLNNKILMISNFPQKWLLKAIGGSLKKKTNKSIISKKSKKNKR